LFLWLLMTWDSLLFSWSVSIPRSLVPINIWFLASNYFHYTRKLNKMNLYIAIINQLNNRYAQEI
jgi:hypothetical protein